MTSSIVDNIDIKHFFMLYSQSKDNLRKGRYCVMFLHYTVQSLVVTTCNFWGFCTVLNDSITKTVTM